MYKRLATGWTALLAGAMAVLSLRPFFESDLFWHLGLGREVLRAHARTVTEPWALPGVYPPRCVVPEWLWDVGTWLLYRAAGYGALHALVALCAGASAVAIVRLARRGDDAPSLAALAPVSALATALAFTRVRERPESAVMVLLPLFVAACLRVEPRATSALPPRRIARALAPLALATLLWAQLHPTAALAAPVFALCAAPRAGRERDALGIVAAGTLAFALLACTGAHGASVYAYAWRHAHGDAVRHIADVTAPTWEFFDPATKLVGPAFAALALIALLGAAAAWRLEAAHAALALLALALAATAKRGVGPGAILLVPLAMDGARALAARISARAALIAGLAAAAGVVALTGRWIAETRGPISLAATTPGRFPQAGLARLARMAPGARVLTSYNAGAYVGFALDGRARTFVDSRTPMYFDEVDYALARVVWTDADALERAQRRYGFDAAVVERSDASCATLERSSAWRAVAVEAGFTTFVRATDGAGAASPLAPCEDDYVLPARCASDAARAALDAAIDALAADGADARFVALVRAERAVACGAGTRSPDAIAALVPDAADAWGYGLQRDRVLARVRLAQGRVGDARALLEPWVERGDAASLALLVAALGRTDGTALRARLERAIDRLDDAAPANYRATLAGLCALSDDAECVRAQALRAAAMGELRAGPALCWLEARAPDPRVRSDARAWRATLPDDPLRDCPGPLLGPR